MMESLMRFDEDRHSLPKGDSRPRQVMGIRLNGKRTADRSEKRGQQQAISGKKAKK